MRDESINQRLYRATLLKTLQVKHMQRKRVCLPLAHARQATCLTEICLSCFQDSLSHVLKNPEWHSKTFTVALQSAPVIREQDTHSVSGENL